MTSIVRELHTLGRIKPPSFCTETHYETIMGSEAYGCSQDNSDKDIYGFCIPPKDYIFSKDPIGFGSRKQNFNEWSEHHITVPGRETVYDLTVYGIVKYFDLSMQGNPNILDSLFVPLRCIIHSSQVGQIIRDNRKLFLHKGCYHKFKGYAFQQLKNVKFKGHQELRDFQTKYGIDRDTSPEDYKQAQPEYIQKTQEFISILSRYKDVYGQARKLPENKKRAASVEKYGYDVKFLSHVVRLAEECQQILEEGDLDIERNKEQLKMIRRGEWTLQQGEEYFAAKVKSLEALYHSSKLQHGPDEEKIKQVLLDCLELHFGTIERSRTDESDLARTLKQIKDLCEKVSL